MTSEQITYRDIPTLLDGKYVYTTDNKTINRIQHLLFSDQSHLTYISEDLHDRSFAWL